MFFSENLWKIGKLMYPCNFRTNLIQSGGILETKRFVICKIVDLIILELFEMIQNLSCLSLKILEFQENFLKVFESLPNRCLSIICIVSECILGFSCFYDIKLDFFIRNEVCAHLSCRVFLLIASVLLAQYQQSALLPAPFKDRLNLGYSIFSLEDFK